MRWCYQIGRSFRYNLVSGQQLITSHILCFSQNSPNEAPDNHGHNCWLHILVGTLRIPGGFVKITPVKNPSRFGVGTSLGRKNIGKTLGISIFGHLLGFANTLCIQAFLVLLCAVSLGPKIEQRHLAPIGYLQSWKQGKQKQKWQTGLYLIESIGCKLVPLPHSSTVWYP